MNMRIISALLIFSWSCEALSLRMEANPIRKVVTLLQDMQKEIQTEGEVEQKMYDKFMCYCDGNTGEMAKSVEEAAQRITELKAKLESSIAEKDQLDQDMQKEIQTAGTSSTRSSSRTSRIARPRIRISPRPRRSARRSTPNTLSSPARARRTWTR